MNSVLENKESRISSPPYYELELITYIVLVRVVILAPKDQNSIRMEQEI